MGVLRMTAFSAGGCSSPAADAAVAVRWCCGCNGFYICRRNAGAADDVGNAGSAATCCG